MTPWAAESRVLYVGGVLYAPGSPTALLTDGSTIAWMGDDIAAQAYRDVVDEVVDLNGQYVTPGFVDGHVHATNTGLTLSGMDLRSCSSATAVLGEVANAVRESAGRPVIGHGWDESTWRDSTMLTRQDLDRASWGGAVFLSRVDVHTALVSSAVLALCSGIEEEPGFRADGLLCDRALQRVRHEFFATVAQSFRTDAQRRFRQHAASLGIVAVHEMATPAFSSDSDLVALLALAKNEPGPLVAGYWGAPAQAGGIEQAREIGAIGVGGDLLVDGSLGSRTACLAHDYLDAPGNHGRLYLDVDQVAEHIIAVTEAQMQGGFHVIGDQAVSVVTDGIRFAVEQLGLDRVRAQRHRLEHLSLATEEQLNQLADCGVIASVQPGFEATWGQSDGMYAQRIGPERVRDINPLGSMMRAGIPLALGSDAPVLPMGGWTAVREAVTHRNPDQRISMRAAFAAHTRGAWRAIGIDAGVLTPGAPAHLACWDVEGMQAHAPDERIARWSTDPSSGVPDLPGLAAAEPMCMRTVVAGRTVYVRNGQ
jgi:predicted amidohydrolase YtcJ